VERHKCAGNGYLHSGAVVSLADTACGYAILRNLPDGASGFTTIELKSDFLGTTLEGDVICVAKPVHKGRTTQVWDPRCALETRARQSPFSVARR
jgi:uncharacterized protein (TIGR00369 family)